MTRTTRRLLAAACVLLLAAACSSQPSPPRQHTRPAARPQARQGPPAGVLSMRIARRGYTALIVPIYPDAVRLADTVANHPARAAAAARGLAGRLRLTEAQLARVTGFPAQAQPAFAAFRADSGRVLHDLAASGRQPPAHRTAADLYVLASQIGQLGVALGLMPANETTRQH